MSVLTAYSSKAAAVTISDTTTYEGVRAVWVGGAGNLAVSFGGTAVTFVGVNAGQILPIGPTKIMSTNTTATSIMVLY